jgi:hypothetical protein
MTKNRIVYDFNVLPDVLALDKVYTYHDTGFIACSVVDGKKDSLDILINKLAFIFFLKL